VIPWGPLRPDTAGPNTGFAAIADNVLPFHVGQSIGYLPIPQFVTTGGAGALSDTPRGNLSLLLDDGSSAVFYATAATIEQLGSAFTFTSIDTGRSVTSGDDVSFLHFGAFLLNTDTTDGFKAYNVQTPAGNNTVAGAPVARFIFSCNNVVFALDCNGNNRRMQSSGVGDHTAWTTLGANGKTFEDGGALVCGVDLKNGVAVIFQTDAMRLIQFGNAVSPALYSITKAADGRGSIGERSVVSFDGMVFYITPGLEFFRFDLQNGNVPIGAEKMDKWLQANISTANGAKIEGAVDPLNKIVWWRFISITNPSLTVSDRLVGYDWQVNEFVTGTVNLTSLTRISTPGYVLDAMDGFGTLDQMQQIPLDDRFWQGGAPLFGGLGSDLKFGTFSGTNAAATLRAFTQNLQLSTLLTDITPISDDHGATLQVGASDDLSSSLTFNSTIGRNRAGRYPVRKRGMNLTLQENHAAGNVWTYSHGLDYPQASKGGPV
jgi:hypothetical protein